jgi:flagellar basal body P-ring formation protein FlgA
MIRTVVASALALALALAPAWEAAAQAAAPEPAPRLKESVAVDSEFVRIGDLVENAGAAAEIAVFRAPDLGHAGAVPSARVVEALRAQGLTGVDTAGLSEVLVTRPSRAITRTEIADRIARAVSGRFSFGAAENLTVNLDRELRTMHVERSAAGDLVITRLHVEPRSGRFDAAFELPGSRIARRMQLRFTGTVTETVEATTLVRALRSGELIRRDDIRVERRPKAEVGTDSVDESHAIGLAATRSLRAGQVLRTGDLKRPQVVQRNDAVTIHYSVPGIVLTVRGKALESGSVGDVVSVANAQSNRNIQATVAGPGQVVVTATRPFVASVEHPSQPRTQ